MLCSFLLRNTHTQDGGSGLLSPGLPGLIFASTAHQAAFVFCREKPQAHYFSLRPPRGALLRTCRSRGRSSPAVPALPPAVLPPDGWLLRRRGGLLPLLRLAGRAHHCTAPGARPPLGCFPESSQGSGTPAPRRAARGVLTRLPALPPPALRTSHRVLPPNALSSLRTRDSLAEKNHLLQEAS